jgi:hypothetical protein
MVANLAKVCWIAGGCFMLCGIVLAVLTVQLAADPDKWQPVAADESALAAARDMLYPRDASRGQAAAAWRAGGAQQQQQGGAPFGAGGGVIAVAAAGDADGVGLSDGGDEEAGDVERQGLLSSRKQGAGASSG